MVAFGRHYETFKRFDYPPATSLKQPNHKALPLNPINFPNSEIRLEQREIFTPAKYLTIEAAVRYHLHTLHIIITPHKKENNK